MWLRLFSIYLFHILVYPLLLIIALISRVMFKKVQYAYTILDDIDLDDMYSQLYEKVKSSIDLILKRGDSAKFIGMLAGETGDEVFLNAFKRYVTNDGKFMRKPNGNNYKNFSGDMWSGYAYCLVIQKDKIMKDEDFIRRLEKVFYNAIFKKPYFTFKSVGNESYLKRGVIFHYKTVTSGNILQMLSFSRIAYEYTKDKRFLFIYYLTYLIYLPILILSPVLFINRGKFRYEPWYHVHTSFILYYVLYLLTGNVLYLQNMMYIRDKMDYNPEFNTILGVDVSNTYDILKEYYTVFKDKKEEARSKTITVYNLKDILRFRFNKAKYKVLEKAQLPGLTDYDWEKSFQKIEIKGTPLVGIDFIVAYHRLVGKTNESI